MLDLNPLSSPSWRDRKQAIEALAGADEGILAQELLRIVREQHDDLNALNAALQLLCELSVPVTPALVRLLSDPDSETRMYAALAMGELCDDGAIPSLMESLNDPSPNVRFNAIEALGKLHAAQAVEPLIAFLESGEFFLAYPALVALTQIGEPAPTPSLLRLLPDPLLGAAAARSLGVLGEPIQTIAGALADWLERGDQEHRGDQDQRGDGEAAAVAAALARLGERLGLSQTNERKAGLDGPDSRRSRLQILVGPLGPAARAKLLAAASAFGSGLEGRLRSGTQVENPGQPGAEALNEENLDIADLARVLAWLLELDPGGDGLQEAVLNLLIHPAARPAATQALARLGERAVPGLSARLFDPSSEMRQVAVRTLADIAHPAAAPPLLEVFESAIAQQDEILARLAARALGLTGSRLAYEPLVAHLAHPSAAVRKVVAQALHALAHPDHRRRLLELIEEEDIERQAAAFSCLALESSLEGEDRWRQVTLAALDSPELSIKKAAVEVLPLFAHPETDAALANLLSSAQAQLRSAAAHALAHSTPAFALPWLHAALDDPDLWTRLHACRSLGQLGQAESAAYLARLVNDPEPLVRVAVAEAMGRIGGPQAAETLAQLSRDPESGVRKASEAVQAGENFS